jgi:phosphoadenosine phosphosulfate reductase
MNSASASLSPSKAQPQPQSTFCAVLDSRIVDKLDAMAVLRLALNDVFPGQVALVSSFGTESALLLALAAEIDRAIPVIFLDTGKLFPETLEYRDRLIERLGLTDVRLVWPEAGAVAAQDPDGGLWRQHADRCCFLRKTLPLQAALKGFDAWVTGRKRFQSAVRRDVGLFEADNAGRIKVNPLAFWSAEGIAAEFDRRELPRHPLEAYGFLSVGCTTCTAPVAEGGDRRAGRWPGQAKTECGIHLPEPALA